MPMISSCENFARRDVCIVQLVHIQIKY